MIKFLLSFMWGACLGSFLTVITHRIHKDPIGIITGRSTCPYCKNRLKTQDLIPLLSYIYYKGKCRMCENKIDKKYPIIELITGILFAILAVKFTLIEIFILSPLLVLFLANVYQDALTQQVESKLLYMLCILSFIYGSWFFGHTISNIFIFGLIGFSFFYLQELLNKNIIGDADSYIGLTIGFLFASMKTLTSIFLAYWVAVLTVVPYFFIKYKSIKNQKVALIPFLFTGFYLNLIF